MPSLNKCIISVRSWLSTRRSLEESISCGLAERRLLRKQLRRLASENKTKDDELSRLISQMEAYSSELEEERRAAELLRRELMCKEAELKGLASAFQGLESITEKVVAVNTAAAAAAAYSHKRGQPYDDVS